MGTTVIDTKGLRCPQPVLKLTTATVSLKPGDLVEIIADCPTFEADLKAWCIRMKKVLVYIRDEGSAKRAQIKI